jgi:hypothetical protein
MPRIIIGGGMGMPSGPFGGWARDSAGAVQAATSVAAAINVRMDIVFSFADQS